MKLSIAERLMISEVSAARRHVIGNLLQLCLHDYSEFAGAESGDFEITFDGVFEYQWLDNYWREVGRVPLLIRTDTRIAGFALINRWSALRRPLDHALAEFFVVRKYRRAGVGSRAFRLILERYQVNGKFR
jgi:predicted acetyltransferase